MFRKSVRRPHQDRKGAIAVMACFFMVGLLGLVAFAVDLGYLANSQVELQRSADAAALAAAQELVYQGTPGTTVNLTSNIQSARSMAVSYAASNPVCKSAPAVDPNSDVTVGYLANPSQRGAAMSFSNPNQFNAVQVTVRRNGQQNGDVPSIFGRIFGSQGQSTSATSTAALINSAGGFGIPSGSGNNLMFLPFALDLQTWNSLLAGTGSDQWSYNAKSNTVSSGTDGILEVNLFPQGTGSPGNRGTVTIGSNNGTSNLVRQIQYGLSASDLAQYGGVLQLNNSGHLYLPANPGISAGTKSALAAIIGQTRIIPIFASVSGNGANATYDVVQFVGVRVLDVNLTGSMSSKHLTVQPANVTSRGILPSAGGSTSYAVYSPVWLVK